MKRRIAILVAAFALPFASLVVAGPAVADIAAPTFSDLDGSTPGHVTGKVHTDQAYARLSFPYHDDVWIPTVSGVATFDYETWGFPDTSVQVQAQACTEAPPSQTIMCSATANGAAVTLTDVVPEVTWWTDDTVGPGQDVSITVSDPDGGGTLWATTFEGYPQQIDRNGTTILHPGDGSGLITIKRCRLYEQSGIGLCRYFSPNLQHPLTVRTATTAFVSAPTTPKPTWNGAISTRVPAVDRLLQSPDNPNLPYTLEWHLAKTGVDQAGTDDSTSGTLSPTGRATFSVSKADVPDGTYDIVGTLTVTDLDFGVITGPIGGGKVVVDRTAPTVSSYSRTPSTFYPKIGKFQFSNTVKFTVTGQIVNAWIEIHTSTGKPIDRVQFSTRNTTSSVSWNGHNYAGVLVPAGVYRGYLVDAAGNLGPSVGSVTVSTKSLVAKTFSKKVQAAGSTIKTYIGKCSQLKRPSSHGWTGSLGYFANTKCSTQTSAASEVHTIHQMKLPAAPVYDQIHVTTYGGAAASKPRSRGEIFYVTTKGSWFGQWLAEYPLRYHVAPNVSAAKYVWSDHYFVWAFATGFNNRYDVRDFTVVLKYWVLV